MQFKVPPMPHQASTFEIAKDFPCWGAWWRVGTGKTWFAQMYIRYKWCIYGRMLPTLIVTLPRPVPGWKKEFLKNTNIDEKRVVLLPGGTSEKDALKLFGQSVVKYGKQFVLIMTYRQLLMTDLFNAVKGWLESDEAAAICWDESHKLKNPKAARTKAADIISNPAGRPKPFIVALSGSPQLKDPMDLFMQFKVLDGGKTFGHNPWIFRARYFRDRNAHIPKERKAPPKWELMTLEKDGVDAEKEIATKMSHICNFVDSGVDLPEEIDEIIYVEMGKDQARTYKEMKKDLITFYNSKACTASLAITKLIRLAQIESGFISTFDPGIDEKPKIFHFPDNPRIDAYKEWLEEMLEMGESCLVWAEHQENYGMLARATQEVFTAMKVKYSYVECHGLVKTKDQDPNLEKFESDPNCRVFLGHPGSGGIGVDKLKKARVDYTYSEQNSLEYYIQKRGRNVRTGSLEMGNSKVVHNTVMVRGGVSEIFHKNLVAKQDMSDSLLNEIINDLMNDAAGEA